MSDKAKDNNKIKNGKGGGLIKGPFYIEVFFFFILKGVKTEISLYKKRVKGIPFLFFYHKCTVLFFKCLSA